MQSSPSPVSSPSHDASESPCSSFPAVERLYSVHDWECYKQKDFYDDGTMTYFWRAHTLTVLFLLSCALVYVALFEEFVNDQEYNSKRGLVACILVFLLLGITQIPDGPFRRPHPVVWRFVFCFTVVYELSLIFILFQSPGDARQLLTHIDKDLGKPLEEKDYGGNCRLYDHEMPSNPFHNILDKFDVFVPSHLFGWWVKDLKIYNFAIGTFVIQWLFALMTTFMMLMIRDWWLCSVVSIMFEFLEYTLEHQLPNFSECWWDHWIMDALLCNGLGIYFGCLTLNYLSIKTYHWRGLWNIPGYRGKLQRIVAQFGPHSWIEFDWKPTSSLSRWLCVIFIICALLLAELNTFYLKFVLWLEPTHYLNPARLVLVVLGGAVALRESFEYLDNPECQKFGRQSWVMLAIVITEFLIIAKFDWTTITKPLPTHILYCWILGAASLTAWTVWNFFIRSAKSQYRYKYSKDWTPDSSVQFHMNSKAATPNKSRSPSSPEGSLKQRVLGGSVKNLNFKSD